MIVYAVMPANEEAEAFRLPTDVPALFKSRARAEKYANAEDAFYQTQWQVVEVKVF